MEILLQEYKLGDMIARYVTGAFDEGCGEQVGMYIIPQEMAEKRIYEKEVRIEPLVQIKLLGDGYPGSFSQGNTMRNSESLKFFRYQQQEVVETGAKTRIITTMTDDRGYEIKHYLIWKQGRKYVNTYTVFVNKSNEKAGIEMISSFSLGGLSPFLSEQAYGQLQVHQIRSRWSMEGRLESRPVEAMQLEPAWNGEAVRAERFGQTGSMPVNNYFPFIALEDSEHHIFWGVQLAHQASWQIELYRRQDGVSLSGGLADREFGHWLKYVAPGECFQTPIAIMSTGTADSLDQFTPRLLAYAEDAMKSIPEAEEELPIVFNEYCTTWGNPSHENITEIVNAIKDKGFTYFVIDCGWYKAPGIPWDISMGDYEPSPEFFTEGLEQTVAVIKQAGLKPGIWFETENVGREAKAYHNTDHLLKRDGFPLTTALRRFWDMQDPWVQDYLGEKVIGQLKRYGFEYIKVDYNDTIGIGCDGAESLGEGLRQHMEASREFYQRIKKEVPGIIIENCASGGHRLEPGLMSITDMASFSDAHECVEIPIVAANMHRVILPRQSQIWAVIRETDNLQRIIYSVAATFLGRMCISGDVTQLNEEQWETVEKGMEFYRAAAPIIKKGQSYRYGEPVLSYRNPEGWQAVVRTNEDAGILVVIHTFGGKLAERIRIPLPEGNDKKALTVYSDREEDIELTGNGLAYKADRNFAACAVLIG